MLSVVLIGTGNVSTKLAQAFTRSEDVQLLGIYGKKERNAEVFSTGHTVGSISEVNENADVIVIAVKDEAISSVQKELQSSKALVVHTAGSIPMDVLLPKKRRGVFYPLQTLSADRNVDFKSVPLCLECASAKDRELLENLARSVSDSISWVDSNERKHLHLAAVFINNFINHMISQAEKVCEEHDLPIDLLFPLLDETVAKAKILGAAKAQTGPAVRGDNSVIEKHLQLLTDKAQHKLYKTITVSIQNEYESQL